MTELTFGMGPYNICIYMYVYFCICIFMCVKRIGILYKSEMRSIKASYYYYYYFNM